MPLKFKYPSRAEVPPQHLGLYVEREGAWVLDAEGGVEKGRLDEFRNNNTELRRKLEALEASLAGVDLGKARELLKKQAELDDASLFKAGDIDRIVERRLAPLQQEISSARAEKAALEARLAEVQINQAALAAAAKRGVRPTAVPDLIVRARGTFKLVNGAPTPLEADGQTVRYSKDGVTPLNFDEWTEALSAEAPHLFESSAGGGAPGNGSGGAGLTSGKNPFKKETLNLTEQSRLLRANPVLAAHLQAAAQ